MTTVERRTLAIMLAIMALQGWALVAALGHADAARLVRLFGFDLAAWPGWIAAAVVGVAFTAHALRALPMIRERVFDITPLKLLAIPFALITGSMEEIWFRKAPMDWASHHGAGVLAQVALSAILFGSVHAVWGVFARHWYAAMTSMIATGALGIGLGVVYLLAGRQVAPCIWVHVAINLVIEPWLLIAVMSRHQQPAALVAA